MSGSESTRWPRRSESKGHLSTWHYEAHAQLLATNSILKSAGSKSDSGRLLGEWVDFRWRQPRWPSATRSSGSPTAFSISRPP